MAQLLTIFNSVELPSAAESEVKRVQKILYHDS